MLLLLNFRRCTIPLGVQTRSLRSAPNYLPEPSVVQPANKPPPSPPTPFSPELTHYKITLRRSAIALDKKVQATLVSLGIHRRHQTVFHRHSPEVAGKVLRVKELVDVVNVRTDEVRTKEEMTLERKPNRGYSVVGNRLKL